MNYCRDRPSILLVVYSALKIDDFSRVVDLCWLTATRFLLTTTNAVNKNK